MLSLGPGPYHALDVYFLMHPNSESRVCSMEKQVQFEKVAPEIRD